MTEHSRQMTRKRNSKLTSTDSTHVTNQRTAVNEKQSNQIPLAQWRDCNDRQNSTNTTKRTQTGHNMDKRKPATSSHMATQRTNNTRATALELITKTYLYNFDPHKPHFYMVKLGFTGYTLLFLFLLKNIDCEYSLEPPRRGGSNEYPQSMFWAEIWKISKLFIWKFPVLRDEIFYIFA